MVQHPLTLNLSEENLQKKTSLTGADASDRATSESYGVKPDLTVALMENLGLGQSQWGLCPGRKKKVDRPDDTEPPVLLKNTDSR